jgi:signal transduction histidine kinase
MKLLRRIGIWFDKHPTGTDGMVAAALVGLAFLNLYINWGNDTVLRAALAIALTLLVILPFTLRRRFPLAVLSFMTVAIMVYRSLNIPESSFTLYALLLAFFSAGAYGTSPWRDRIRLLSAFATIGYLTYSVFFIGRGWIFPVQTALSQVSVVLAEAFLFGAAWWIGNVFRIRRIHETELQERTIQLEQERDENARRAVLDERVRIARELHDVVAHHVSVMGIQAGAARRILRQQPEKANEVLSLIEASSRQAVAELQRLLGFLRQESQVDELAPLPSLNQLDVLVKNMREAGLPIEVKIEGEPQPLPPGVDLSAYRIVQEALTNTLKHAGSATAYVTLRYVLNTLELEIRDTGSNQVHDDIPGKKGRGLIGMRERVTLHGGEFFARGIPGVGFIVRATLPLTGRVR